MCVTPGASYQHASGEQGELGGVGVQADLVLSRRVRREGEPPLRAVLPGQDDLRGTRRTLRPVQAGRDSAPRRTDTSER